ncbi:MAG: methyltransferase domain-containing protein [Alphaproteobacteria bacterium]|nr:methyltransferase domain-containing protein [Alphaproteobacteria bacterium]
MDFSGNVGEWQRNVSEGKAGKHRRMKVIEALNIKNGQSIIDIGCGGGHLLKELGMCVGEKGHISGLDNSPQQLENAKTYCSEYDCIRFIEGSAASIPCGAETFDALAAIQTYEYIEEVDPALKEARRVLKLGCPIAIVSILWDHCLFYGADEALNQTIFEAFKAHCSHQMLPMELSHLLPDNGFGSITRQNLSYLETALNAGMAGYYLSKLMALFATTKGVSNTDAQLWLSQLEQADKDGRFGFVNFPVLTMATAI